MNLFSEHSDFLAQGESRNNGRKFSAFHHLSMNVRKNLTIGLFENIIFDRSDSTENNRYEVSYLNPLIFYRAVEHGLNSRDNASLGVDIKWNFLYHFSFYGQYLLDELVTSQLFGRTESWVNKWAYQAGIKYIDVANVKNLDLQLEVNHVRPYFNMHRTKSQNWILQSVFSSSFRCQFQRVHSNNEISANTKIEPQSNVFLYYPRSGQ